jgi:hypothetical protein
MFLLLVCGGRDFTDKALMHSVLDGILKKKESLMVIHGDAKGADRMAGDWARERLMHEVKVPALWDAWPKKGGPIRNAAMLHLKPQGVVAFPGGSGTADMVAKAEAAGIPVFSIRPRPKE